MGESLYYSSTTYQPMTNANRVPEHSYNAHTFTQSPRQRNDTFSLFDIKKSQSINQSITPSSVSVLVLSYAP